MDSDSTDRAAAPAAGSVPVVAGDASLAIRRRGRSRTDPASPGTRYLPLVLAMLLAGAAAGCAHRHLAPMQPDGWSAQPIVIGARFTADADLDPATGAPVGDEGYFLYVLTEAANWNLSTATSFVFSIWQRPLVHGWIILGSPRDRLELGQTGDFGLQRPRYYQGVMQRARDGDRDPIAYLWETMSDGKVQIGKPNRPPTFVWRMPITRRRHQLIHDYVTHRTYDQFGVRTNNCTDMVVATAALAGINLSHRIRLTLPPETKFWGRTLRVWTDPQYQVLEFSTPEVLEVDLRQLAQVGIGSDATEWYLALKR